MKWMGKELKTREDYALALKDLYSVEDANIFREAFRVDYPEWTDEILGYLTGEVPPPHSARARLLLCVKHPLNPNDDLRTPAQAFEMGQELAKNPPVWLMTVLKIPRENWSGDWPERLKD